jgi:hypothetical protein
MIHQKSFTSITARILYKVVILPEIQVSPYSITRDIYRVTPKTTQLSSFRILFTVSKFEENFKSTQVSRIRKNQTQKFFISNVFT